MQMLNVNRATMNSFKSYDEHHKQNCIFVVIEIHYPKIYVCLIMEK